MVQGTRGIYLRNLLLHLCFRHPGRIWIVAQPTLPDGGLSCLNIVSGHMRRRIPVYQTLSKLAQPVVFKIGDQFGAVAPADMFKLLQDMLVRRAVEPTINLLLNFLWLFPIRKAIGKCVP